MLASPPASPGASQSAAFNAHGASLMLFCLSVWRYLTVVLAYAMLMLFSMNRQVSV